MYIINQENNSTIFIYDNGNNQKETYDKSILKYKDILKIEDLKFIIIGINNNHLYYNTFNINNNNTISKEILHFLSL